VAPVERSYIDIVMAVVIVVANGAPEAIKLRCESRFLGYVGKRTVLVIVIERWIGVSGPMPGPIPGVNEEDVLPSIAVVIDHADTATHSLRQILLTEGAGVMAEVNPCLRSDVGKSNRP
jgi:hypothetical protein